MNQFLVFLQKNALVGILTAGLGLFTIGITTNFVINWLPLTSFFSIIKHFAGIFDFMWDTDTMFQLIGYGFIIMTAYWTFKGVMLIVRLFRTKQ